MTNDPMPEKSSGLQSLLNKVGGPAKLFSTGSNALLRGLSLAARFVIIVILARTLGPAEFGVFTLIMTTEIIAILTLGFELNAYSRREIVNASTPFDQLRHIRDQMTITGLLGLAAPLIIYGAALCNLFPVRLVPLVALITFLDLLSQEGIRVLYALQRVIMANTVYFVRSSAWVLVIVALLFWNPHTITITLTLYIWAAFSFSAICVFVHSLRHMPWRGVLHSAVDWDWIRRGFGVAAPFFISTAFVNVLSYLPRYILFYLRGNTETGVFGLYASIAVGIVNLLSTITIPSGIAQAVYAFKHHGQAAFERKMRALWYNATALTAVLSVGLLAVFPFILPFVGKKNYPLDWVLLILLVAANGAQVASMVAQTALYAKHRDKEILAVTVISGVISAFLQYGMAYIGGMRGLAAAIIISMLILTGLLAIMDRRFQPSNQGSGDL